MKSSFAKVDPAHFMDGLWVPKVKKGDALYDVEGEFDGGIIRFEGVQLTAKHQSVLLALCARTAQLGSKEPASSLEIRGDRTDLEGKQASLFDLVQAPGIAKEKEFSRVSVSAYALLNDAGMNVSSAGYDELKRILLQLSTITIYREVNGKWGMSQLISRARGVNGNESIQIDLNWRLADAIFGGQNVRVSLEERRELGLPVAKILHGWLSAYVREGGKLGFGNGAKIDTLVSHVWGKRPCSDVTLRKRRALIRAALENIASLNGWQVEMTRKDLVKVSRLIEIVGAQQSSDFT